MVSRWEEEGEEECLVPPLVDSAVVLPLHQATMGGTVEPSAHRGHRTFGQALSKLQVEQVAVPIRRQVATLTQSRVR